MALSACEKYLKKKSSKLLLCLKAMILAQLGRDQQAHELASSLVKADVVDMEEVALLSRTFVLLNDCTLNSILSFFLSI